MVSQLHLSLLIGLIFLHSHVQHLLIICNTSTDLLECASDLLMNLGHPVETPQIPLPPVLSLSATFHTKQLSYDSLSLIAEPSNHPFSLVYSFHLVFPCLDVFQPPLWELGSLSREKLAVQPPENSPLITHDIHRQSLRLKQPHTLSSRWCGHKGRCCFLTRGCPMAVCPLVSLYSTRPISLGAEMSIGILVTMRMSFASCHGLSL